MKNIASKKTLITTALSSMVLSLPVSSEESAELNGIVVTGQKIERSQLETVSSVKVISSEELSKSSRANNLYEVIELAPNVTDTGGFNQLAIRGISNTGPTNANNGAGTIGVFIDNGLVTARGVQKYTLTTWDVESIEILRGPQSTTGGRNSLAGQILIKTKDPEFKSTGDARISYGEFGTWQTAIAQTGAITEKLAFRFSADYQETDGFVTNDILDDDEFNRSDAINYRLKLLYVLDSDGEFLLTLNHNEFNEHGDDTVDRNLSGRTSRLNFPSEWETETDTISLKFTQPIGHAFSFESNTGYVTSDFYRTTDFDGSSSPAFVTELITNQQIPTDQGLIEQQTDDYNFTQEFLLRYNGERIRSVAGLYYAEGELDDYYATDDVLFNFPDPGLGYPGGLIPLLLNSSTNPDESFESYAIFGDIDFDITNKFTLNAGLRANKEKRKSSVTTAATRAVTYGPLDPTIDALLAGFSGDQSSNKESTVLLPKIGFNYKWSNSLSTGMVVQKGYRPGGVSVNPIRGVAQEYDDEETINYEASLRAQINSNASVSANIFYTDWKDQQVAVDSPGAVNPLDFLIENAGESHLQGFEVETNVAVNEKWDLFVGVGYTKTEFDEFEVNGDDFSGEEFQFSRNWTANLANSYQFTEAWSAHANISYASEGASATGSTDTELDAYTLVNIKVGYSQPKWSVFMYANNVFDDKYSTQRVNNATYGNTSYGDPRVIGLIANLHW